MASLKPTIDPIDALLSAHGLRRTSAARMVLGWLLAHPEISYTHAQLQAALQGDSTLALDRVTLYRLIDRLTQVGLLLCRVDANRVRRYQAMPASLQSTPHFECQSCHRDRPLSGELQGNAGQPPIEAGETITTGTLTEAMPAVPGDRWTFACVGLGCPDISLRLA